MAIKIMHIDDDSDILFTVKRILENSPNEYEVTSVSNAEECLKKLSEDETPDLIILDIMMPTTSGWELFNDIKENQKWNEIPIIFLTARNDKIAIDAGSFLSDEFLIKPFKMQDLIDKIEKILNK
jgi:CheY-like chemotaxis protein